MAHNWGYTEDGLKHYTALRTSGPIVVDGRLDEASWQRAPRSPRFEDLEEQGRPALFDTQAAMLWDDDYLYVGFWCEETDLRATQTARDCMVCTENDVEVFIAGPDAYFEFELNALGTVMERFYIWQDGYVSAGYCALPEFDLGGAGIVDTLGGSWSGHQHPRGRRWCFRNWDMPGLRWAVHLEGTLNDDSDVDRGWTAEIAFPWKGLKHLAGGRGLPARGGDVWRMDVSRFEWIGGAGRRTCPGWAWNTHLVYDSHIPERFTYIHFSEAAADSAADVAKAGPGELAVTRERSASPSVVYRCPRAGAAPGSPGRLDAPWWDRAPRTTRFVDAAAGGVACFDTTAALAWDDTHLYVGAWLQERDVWSTGEARRGLVWQENTFELFVAADGALYQLSINPAGVTQELLFVWKDTWARGGRYDTPDLDLATHAPMVVGGDSGPHHRRGLRWMFDNWHLQGLRCVARVDGNLNERHELDRGWTVELALPWTGLCHVVDGPCPPAVGQRLRVALARNQVIDQRQARWTTQWSWHVAGAEGLYAPEGYPVVELAAEPLA